MGARGKGKGMVGARGYGAMGKGALWDNGGSGRSGLVWEGVVTSKETLKVGVQ